MKIRTDFVTNSSSSSFVVTLTIGDKKGNEYYFDAGLFDVYDDGGDVRFYGDLKKAREKKSVEELCKFLLSGIDADFLDEIEDYDMHEDDEDDEYEFDDEDREALEDQYEFLNENKEKFDKAEAEFIEKVTSNIKKVKDIKFIEVRHDYYAWGEFADLVADNDETLCDLAEEYLKAEGRKKNKAKKKLIKYIETPNGKRAVESFGVGYENFVYSFAATDESIDALAKRLTSCNGPGSVEGYTSDILMMKNGKIKRCAVFELN